MRFVLKTQPYEKPIAAGAFRYEQDGAAIGIIESWSLAHALDGYKFFRVDVDARSLKSDGYSSLFNVLVGPDGKPENVKFRHFTVAPPAAENGLRIKGQIAFDDDIVFVTREFGGNRFEDEFEMPLALSLPVAARWQTKDPSAGILTLNLKDDCQPLISPIGPKILDTAENGYPQKVALSDGTTAVSTRLVIYR